MYVRARRSVPVRLLGNVRDLSGRFVGRAAAKKRMTAGFPELNRPIREIFAVISRQMLEVAEADLDLEAGFVHVKGAPGMPQIARRVC
jgi:hypothetical protein